MNNKKKTDEKQKSELKYFGLFVFLISLIFLFSYYKPTAAGYSVFKRAWGFDLVSFYSVRVQGFILLLALLVIIPKTNLYLIKFFNSVAIKISELKHRKHIVFIIAALISVFIFYAVRVKYFFLGDFNLRLEQIMKQDFLKTEYLTMKILYWFSVAGSKFGFSAMEMFTFYSCLAGGVFVFFCLLIADLLGKTDIQKLFFFLIQISTSLILVFCGYIEVYATPVVFLTIYIYSGLRYLRYKNQFLVVLASLLVAVASHLMNLAIVPSIFILWYFNNKSKLTFVSSAGNKNIAIVIGVVALAAVILAFNIRNNFVLPLTAPPNSTGYMVFFSIAHFWEIINGQILCCGISFILFFILLSKIIKKKIKTESQNYFLISIAGCLLLIIVMANLQRGSGDWDIMSFTAIPLNILTLSLISVVYKNNSKLISFLQICIIGLNTIHAALWIHINHTDKSIQKIEKMLINDPGTYYSRLPSSIQLAMIYKANNLLKQSEALLITACNNSPDTDLRPCEMYGKELIERNKIDQARDFYENLLQRSKFVPHAYVFLLEYYQKQNNKPKFNYYLEKLFDAFMQKPNYFLSKAEPRIYLGLFEYLYTLELPKNDSKKLSEISFAVKTLKTIKPNRIK